MSLHEQARAEAEKASGQVIPVARFTYADGFKDGFLAGHEAAIRQREVTSVTELDALSVGSVVLDRHGEAWRKTRTGDWTAAALGSTTSSGVPLPARVLYDPEEES